MIDFCENDYNLVAIRRESKMFNLASRYPYRVYGLRQENNPPILIEYNYERVDDGFEDRLTVLVEFFKAHGIQVDTYSESEDGNKVFVGMRRDLREHVNKNGKPILASAIVSTIIYCLEGRIDVDALGKYKLPSIPNFQANA